MKKFCLAIALVGAVASTHAEPYAAISLGSSHADWDCTGTSACDNSDTGSTLFVGQRISSNLGIEVGYLNFGENSAMAGPIGLKLRSSGLGAGLALFQPIAPRWQFIGRLGLAGMTVKASAINGVLVGPSSDSAMALYAGLGLSYDLNRQTAIQFGYDFSRARYMGDDFGVGLLSAGLRFSFQ